jgi:hypothetical protein
MFLSEALVPDHLKVPNSISIFLALANIRLAFKICAKHSLKLIRPHHQWEIAVAQS